MNQIFEFPNIDVIYLSDDDLLTISNALIPDLVGDNNFDD